MPETKIDDGNLRVGDALLVVDMQNDFMPGGALGVHGGDQIIPEVNRLVETFIARRLPIVFSRDWHPPNHCSFKEQGGIWPTHCVRDTKGAAFTPGLSMPSDPSVVSKATKVDHEAYSAFDGTGLGELLTRLGSTRVFIVGLATDYCVLETVKDARREGFEVVVPEDGVRAVNVHPEDGSRALEEMAGLGARILTAEAAGEPAP